LPKNNIISIKLVGGINQNLAENEEFPHLKAKNSLMHHKTPIDNFMNKDFQILQQNDLEPLADEINDTIVIND
jgi:hypothetical protein